MNYDLTLSFNHILDQTKNQNFTELTYSMMMEIFEYHNLLKQLNEKKGLIFDDVMHRK